MNPFSKKHNHTQPPDMRNNPISFKQGVETVKHTYTPTSDMRTNPLSKTCGGENITIIRGGYNTEYTNIKNISAYLEACIKNDPTIIGYIYKGRVSMIN